MSTTPTFNIKRAEDVLRSIFAMPESHQQDQWFDVYDFQQLPDKDATVKTVLGEGTVETRTVTIGGMLEGSCGSTACIAGWAALHAGWQIRTSMTTSPDGWENQHGVIISPNGEEEEYSGGPDLETEGAEALGLSEEDAHSLFFTMNEHEAIIQLYSLIKGDELYDNNVWDLAEHFDIEVSEKGEFIYNTEEYDELLEKVTEAIKDEYPPLTKSEWENEQVDIIG